MGWASDSTTNCSVLSFYQQQAIHASSLLVSVLTRQQPVQTPCTPLDPQPRSVPISLRWTYSDVSRRCELNKRLTTTLSHLSTFDTRLIRTSSPNPSQPARQYRKSEHARQAVDSHNVGRCEAAVCGTPRSPISRVGVCGITYAAPSPPHPPQAIFYVAGGVDGESADTGVQLGLL